MPSTATAMSPRRTVKLHSTCDTPRRSQSVYQTVALARGFTVKAGRITRERLRRGWVGVR